MRCLSCGAEMGQHKVCPVCNTPGHNVLCGQEDTKENNWEETQIMYQEMLNVPDAVYEKEKNNNEKANETSRDEEHSVLPKELFEVKKKDKLNKKKKTKCKIAIIVVLVLVIVVFLSIIVIKNIKYWSGLPEITVTFFDGNNEYDVNGNLMIPVITEEQLSQKSNKYAISNSQNGAIWSEKTENQYDIYVLSDNGNYKVQEHLNNISDIYISSNAVYAAYSTTWTYKKWVEDHSTENGGYYDVITVVDLYRVSPYGECKRMASLEEKVELSGVTDNGAIIYVNKDENNTVVLMDNMQTAIDGEINKAVVFSELNAAVFLSDNGDLYYMCPFGTVKNENVDNETVESYLIATGVENFIYTEDDKYNQIVKSVNGIMTSDSSSSLIMYTKNGNTYIHNCISMDVPMRLANETVRADGVLNINAECILYEKDGKYYQFDKQKNGTWIKTEIDNIEQYYNKCGKGHIELRDGTMHFCNLISRKLDKADEIKCLAGTWVYYVKENKLYRQNIFSKKIEKLFDRDMKIEISIAE